MGRGVGGRRVGRNPRVPPPPAGPMGGGRCAPHREVPPSVPAFSLKAKGRRAARGLFVLSSPPPSSGLMSSEALTKAASVGGKVRR